MSNARLRRATIFVVALSSLSLTACARKKEANNHSSTPAEASKHAPQSANTPAPASTGGSAASSAMAASSAAAPTAPPAPVSPSEAQSGVQPTDTANLSREPHAPASAVPPASPASGGAPSGSALYAEHCATCHMADGSGVPRMQPALVDSPLASADPAVLIRIILKGSSILQRPAYSNEMPAFASLNDADIAAIASYVRAEFVQKPTVISPDLVATVRAEKP